MPTRFPFAAILLMLSASVSNVVLAQEGSIDPQPEDFAEFVTDILDTSSPLLSCDDVKVTEILGCAALCKAVGGDDEGVDLKKSRDINGDYICTCDTDSLVVCNDRPTCVQLTIRPGDVAARCGAVCGDLFTAFEDKVEYAGQLTNANKNQTHFVLECRCDGIEVCSDYILFSDLTFPSKCNSLSVDSDETCSSFCSAEGSGLFDLGHNYTVSEDNEAICNCLGSDFLAQTKVAQACSDIDVPLGPDACTLQNPCPPVNNGSGNGDGDGDGDGAGTIKATVALWAFTALASIYWA